MDMQSINGLLRLENVDVLYDEAYQRIIIVGDPKEHRIKHDCTTMKCSELFYSDKYHVLIRANMIDYYSPRLTQEESNKLHKRIEDWPPINTYPIEKRSIR